ncbi:transient receptor potential channel pyrexia-like isoform X2 [Odontomachus brunneus]|uniref:transient receptor potential channel pyrexia-like isoform X2 n=1 Tax=Odontomachus brunneus TaxID=486640 RepID=UPI0013F2B075|nr:transient receptor potential channel pyrexia-like isoform X2 [Odontomachus brunneus]
MQDARSEGLLQVTALHVAAWQGKIDLMDQLYAKGADVNAADKIGRCALFYAAHCGYVDVTQWILERGGDIHAKVGINSCAMDIHNSTLMRSSLVGKMLPSPTCLERTALHQAVKYNHADVVHLLVQAGADVNANDAHFVTPLLLAGSGVDRDNAQEMAKFVKIIKILMSKKAFVNIIHPDTGTTALHHAAVLGSVEATELLLANDAWPMFKCKSSGSTPLHIAASNGSTETLVALLKVIQPHGIDTRDQLNRTALHRASYQGHRDCVRILINQGGNLAAMTQTGVTVADAIFAHIPRPLAFLTDILDSCVKTSNNYTSEKYDNITVDFSILAPKYQMQIKVVKAIIAASSNIAQLAILQHPLVETFLRLKWARLRTFFFILVLVHIVFVTSLSTYGLVIAQNLHTYQLHRPFLAVSAGIIFINTIIQILVEPRHYLRQYETWLFLVCTALSLATSIADECDYNKQKNQTQEMEATKVPKMQEERIECPEWLLHCLSITILLGWIQMMLLIGRFPMCGYYALMFSAVLKNMLKVFLAFCCLIVGFALSFIVLFKNDDKNKNDENGKENEFRNLWRAVVRTVVMMMGEYEYEDLFQKKHLPITTRIVFFIFTMLVSIVLINLMIGLAVNDIQAIEREGHTRRLLKQADFIAHLERLTSHRIFRRNCLRPRLKIHSSRDIPTKITLSYRENYSHHVSHIEAPRDISCELKEALFLLATKNCYKNNFTGEKNAEDADARMSTLLSSLEEQLRKWKSHCTNSTRRNVLKWRRVKKIIKPRAV